MKKPRPPQTPVPLGVEPVGVSAPVRRFIGHTSVVYRIVLSPDGRAVAFTGRDAEGRRRLWVRRLGESEARALPATDGAHDPFWSPDGRALAFFSDGKLRTVALDGSPPVALCDVASNPLAGVWSRDANTCYRMGRGIKAGRVWTNCYHAYPAHAAFGGYKQSGIGRETHRMMLEHYQQTKNLLVSYSPKKLGFF